MKKFLVLVVAVFMGLMKVRGINIMLFNDEDSEVIKYVHQGGSYTTRYSLSPFSKFMVQKKDYWKINNLSFYGRGSASEIENATIQGMIWQIVHPNYSYKLLDDNGKVIDNSYYDENYRNYVDLKICTPFFNDSYYEVDYGDVLKIETGTALYKYEFNTPGLTYNNMSLFVSGYLPGTYDFSLYAPLAGSISGNYVQSEYPYPAPVSFKVRVRNYKHEISFKTVSKYYGEDEVVDELDAEIIVKNLDFDYTQNCNGNCTMNLEEGNYLISNNKTNEKINYEVKINDNLEFVNYIISRIKSDVDITSIKKNDVDLKLNKDDNYYSIDGGFELTLYDIVVDGKIYNVDLSNQANYLRDADGTYYNLVITKEVIENDKSSDNKNEIVEEVKKDKNLADKKCDEVIIKVPDTFIEIPKVIIYYDKKDYYINCINM